MYIKPLGIDHNVCSNIHQNISRKDFKSADLLRPLILLLICLDPRLFYIGLSTSLLYSELTILNVYDVDDNLILITTKRGTIIRRVLFLSRNEHTLLETRFSVQSNVQHRRWCNLHLSLSLSLSSLAKAYHYSYPYAMHRW